MNQYKHFYVHVLLFINIFATITPLSGSNHNTKKHHSVTKNNQPKQQPKLLVAKPKNLDWELYNDLTASNKTTDGMYNAIINQHLNPQTIFNNAILANNLELANKLLNSVELDISWALALSCHFCILDPIVLMLDNEKINKDMKKRFINAFVSGEDFPRLPIDKSLTPLMFALTYYTQEADDLDEQERSFLIIKLLLDNGANPSLENDRGQNAIDMVRKTKHNKDIIEMLEAYMPKAKKRK